MYEVGETLVAVQEAICAEVSRAIRDVDGLIGSDFVTAKASGTYGEKFLELSKALREVNESLGPLGEFLKGYSQQVVDTDSAFAGMLG